MSFFGAVPGSIDTSFGGWGGSQSTQPLGDGNFTTNIVTPPLSRQGSQVGIFTEFASQPPLFGSQNSTMTFSFNKFELNAPVGGTPNVALFGGGSTLTTPAQTPFEQPTPEQALLDAAPEDSDAMLDDDEPNSDASISAASFSTGGADIKFAPTHILGPEQLKAFAREQAKRFPKEMRIALPGQTQQEQLDNAAARQKLTEVHRIRENLIATWTELNTIQGQLLAAHIATPGFINQNFGAFEQLQAQLQTFGQNVQEAMMVLFEIIRCVVADNAGLHAVRSELVQLEQMSARAELYLRELRQITTNPQGFPVCDFRIVQQPLPQVVFKSKEIEDNYIVQILLGSQARIDSCSEVRALISSDDSGFKSANELENNVADLDTPTQKASFHRIKINVSSRMGALYLRFAAQLERNGRVQKIQTENSFPFIVITNESQWADAAGRLFLYDAFGNQNEVPWPQLANTLHSHYLHATNQNLQNAERPIFPYEFKYFHEKWFDGAPMVSQAKAREFWNFFGQCLQTIRFKRYILKFWISGLVFGFMDKTHCNSLLDQQGVGIFLIRFSESNPGLFDIAHNSGDPEQNIKHCLVKSENIGSNKTLAEFLRERDQFQILLFLRNAAEGIVNRSEKDDILGEFYSKKEGIKPTKGYIIL